MSESIPAGYTEVPALSSERQTRFPSAGQATEAGKKYVAVMETSKGAMTIELFADKTPKTVNNFVWLARHHYYDGIVFHRVIDGFMAQTGDPTGTGRGGPGYQFADEFASSLRHDSKGTISMANSGPNTNGSQIFITFTPTPHLDDRHAVFGRVTVGLDVLDRITRIEPGRAGSPDRIEKVTIYQA